VVRDGRATPPAADHLVLHDESGEHARVSRDVRIEGDDLERVVESWEQQKAWLECQATERRDEA
jgi:hypothetical protein